MSRQSASLLIAQTLAKAWEFHQSPSFVDYAKEAFGCSIDKPVKCDEIYIGEAEEGDARAGMIGSMIKQWWIVNDSGLIATEFANLPFWRDDPENLRLSFYLKPVIKFFFEGENITIGEAYGPEMRCRKIGTVSFMDDSVKFLDLKVEWNSRSFDMLKPHPDVQL